MWESIQVEAPPLLGSGAPGEGTSRKRPSPHVLQAQSHPACALRVTETGRTPPGYPDVRVETSAYRKPRTDEGQRGPSRFEPAPCRAQRSASRRCCQRGQRARRTAIRGWPRRPRLRLPPRRQRPTATRCSDASSRSRVWLSWSLRLSQSPRGRRRPMPPHSIASWTCADGFRIRSRPPFRREWFAIRSTDRSPVESMNPTPLRSRTTVEGSRSIPCPSSTSNLSAVERLSSPLARTMSTSPACSKSTASGASLRVVTESPISRSKPRQPGSDSVRA